MPTIRDAAQALAARCDGAVEEDGAGFNKPDQWVKDLLRFPRWTAEQQQEVKDTIHKYQAQLARIGIDRDTLEGEETIEVEGRGVLDHQGGQFIFTFPYSENIKDALKETVAGRRWDPDAKRWWAPSTSFESVELFAAAQGFQVTETAQKFIDACQHLGSAMNTPVAQLAAPIPAKSIVVTNGRFEIRFPFEAGIKDDLKQNIPGRGWEPEGKFWTAPLTSEMEVRAFAARFDFVLGKSVKALPEQRQTQLKASKATDSTFMLDHRSKSGKALYPYQRAGAEFLVKNERCYLADAMRLGKTVQAVAALHATQALPALIICPSSVVSVWQSHVAEWLPGKRVRTAPASPDACDVYIISYDRAQKSRDRLKAIKWQAVICDEAHKLKNRTAKRTQAILGHGDRRDGTYVPGLVDGVRYRWLLTGTAVEKRPVELIQPLMGLGRLDDIGGFAGFAGRYCGWVKGIPGSIQGCVTSRLPELNQRLRESGIWLRRVMEDVYTELPEKTFVHVPLVMKNARRYFAEASDAFSKDYEGSAEAITEMTKLRRIAAEEKTESALEWVEEFLDDSEDQKLVLLGWHTAPLEVIYEHFRQSPNMVGDRAVILTGSSTAEQRKRAMERFQTDPACRLFVGNILAAGEGINLSAASDVAIFELPWNASTLDQGIARILHPGKTTRMGIHYLLAQGSIDEDIAAIVDEKRKVAAGIHDGRVTNYDDAEMVTRLLKRVQTKAPAVEVA